MKSGVVVLAALLLVGCGTFEEFERMRQQTERWADAFEQEMGVRPEIAFNIHNDEFQFINVIFESAGVRELQVAELEARVHGILATLIDGTPQFVLVSIRARGDSVRRAAAAAGGSASQSLFFPPRH